MNCMIEEIEVKAKMEGHEEDDLDDLNSTVYTFPPNVQNVIEQVKFIMKLSNCLQLSLIVNK